MSKIIFAYNLEKDIENYLDSIYQVRRLSHGRKKYQEMAGRYLFPEDYLAILKARNEKSARKIIEKIVKELLAKNEVIYSLTKDLSEKTWKKKEKHFFILLEKFFNKPVYFDKVTALFTTLPVCPYNRREGWFMVSLRHGLEDQMRTIFHELMHFMFLGYYWNYTYQALGKNSQKAEMIKESLTVFLNDKDFRKINTIYDRGYPQEKALREHLFSIRQDRESFLDLLNEAIAFLKDK